ncbi:MAG: hypothetical protein Kow0068_00880 [Marinilabiliales bacterium]
MNVDNNDNIYMVFNPMFTDSMYNYQFDTINYTVLSNKFIMLKLATNNTNIDEQNLNNITLIYPNPSKDIFNIKLPETQTERSNTSIPIIDSKGIIIETFNKNTTNFTIDLSKMEQGIFYFHFKSDNLGETHRVIKLWLSINQ